jgi:F0F1-type ATP synthase assembly protein I
VRFLCAVGSTRVVHQATQERMTVPRPAAPDHRPSAGVARRGLWSGIDQASVMGVELLAAILTWAGVGYLADRALGTGPWLLLVGSLVGYAAGLYLIWLRSGRMSAADGGSAGEEVVGAR